MFGYDDFVTTVDNTVMVFTPDANGKSVLQKNPPPTISGKTKSSSTTRASNIVSTDAHNLEPLIQVSPVITTEAASIQPSKVTADSTTSLSVQPSKVAGSENYDKLADDDDDEEEEEDGEEKLADGLSTEFRTEKSVTISSSSSLEPFTSDENKIDTTNEVSEKVSYVKAINFKNQNEEKLKGRPSSSLSYKERLKERLAKEKAKLSLKNFSKESTSERRMFSLESDEDQRGSSFKPRIPRERRFRSRFDQVLRKTFHRANIFIFICVRLRERMMMETR